MKTNNVMIHGKSIDLRLVDVSDAEFIFDMRMNENKTQFLSKVTGTLSDQIQWIEEYKKRESLGIEYYFVIQGKSGTSFGLVRVYDFKGDSFCWGSWLIHKDAPMSTAIESALQIYEFAFFKLGFNHCHFDVRKGNTKVLNFHEHFGSVRVDENDIDIFFSFNKEAYLKVREKYKRYL